ncbi:hypothetical protein HHK36_009270 [Tetracentron sinense]|uniref:Pathogen-related protein n=1 Tax=Tetracentron sinense TaxID=13715 RepID=A0A835DKV6_TETSI|nr:hypothetical protein HHK36_009270 [Tetracentron sinense]
MASTKGHGHVIIAEDKYRSHIYGEGEKNTQWRFGGPPNFGVVNKLFEEGRTKEWSKGSLEERVQRLVKTWEMEIFHKTSVHDFKTINPEKFTISLNGRKPLTLGEGMKIGGYNIFLQTSMPESLRAYNPSVETSESSHRIFTTTFPRGFALEILQVYSGPPVIVYKFRHWAFMEGPFKSHAPTGEMVEFYGIGIFTVDESMRVEKVEFFYDADELIGSLIKGPSIDGSEASATSSLGCPFLNKFCTSKI